MVTRIPETVCSKGHPKTGDNALQNYKYGKKDGLKCRICQQERHRKGQIRRLYGLSWEDYLSILKEQDNKCAICRTDNPGKRNWHVDHNHLTGKVRSLLCSNCNICLGKAKDDPILLRKMADYIESRA